MTRYSLWEEPWIPIITSSGRLTAVGVRDAIVKSHEIRAVFDPSPLVTVGIHRLLLAVLYRVFHPMSNADWISLWSRGRFDAAAVDEYGETWSQRFDLFDPQHPFYQVPLIPDEKWHPISALIVEAASGNNPTLFDHGLAEGETSLSPDRAACHLVAYQQFALGGGVSKPFNRMDAPLAKGIVVEAVERDLFHTLLLNLMPIEQWNTLVPQTAEDAPIWEVDDPPEPVREGTIPLGPMHYLTWQSRQVHLKFDEHTGRVTECQILQRYALPRNGMKYDPAKAYSADEETGWEPVRLRRDRAAWQYTNTLLQSFRTDLARPILVDWLATLRRDPRCRQGLPRVIELQVSGLTTDPKKAAKIDLWRRERLPVPVEVLEDPNLVTVIEGLLEEAQRVERLLLRAGVALVWACDDPSSTREAAVYTWTGRVPADKKFETQEQLAKSLELGLRYWPNLEGPFRDSLERISIGTIQDVRDAWRKDVQEAAREAFRSARDSLLYSEAPFEVLARIDHAFETGLSRIFNNKGEEGADEND